MRIAFDAQLLMKGEKTGIGWCAENILMQMAEDKENFYQLNCFSFGYSDEQFQNVKKFCNLGYQIKKCAWFHDVVYRMMWNFFAVPYSLFFGKDADITLFFNFVIPPGVKGKKITIVHDMAYKAYPETVRKRTRDLLNLALEKSCERADKIITVSEFSKQEIIKYLGTKEEKIVVMPNGVDFTLYHPNYTEKEIQYVKEKYNIDDTYLLYLGTLEPRKNIERLIKAYAKLVSEVTKVPKLVLAGRKGWMFESIFELVKKLHIEEKIIFTGYIEAKDAPVLMKGAEIFLFPSLYEGFGMPPLEAMACGTPVLVSDTSSLPEVVGDAGVLVDPFSVEDIMEGMRGLLLDEEKKASMAVKGSQRAKLFTWDRAALVVKKCFKELELQSEGE